MKWIALAVLVGVLKHLGVMGLVLAPIYAARRFRRTVRRGADARPESGGRARR
jgi:hypothetical protein